jgi:GNAT superfamily N-acetyltransferase
VYPEDDGTDERHLVAMWVEPAFRGTTTATDLVEAVCRWAGERGARTVALWVADGNDRARRFYDRLGFAATGRRQPLPSNPDVGEELMRRSLRG